MAKFEFGGVTPQVLRFAFAIDATHSEIESAYKGHRTGYFRLQAIA